MLSKKVFSGEEDEENAAPEIKMDLEAIKKEKLDKEQAHVRALGFLKRMKEFDK